MASRRCQNKRSRTGLSFDRGQESVMLLGLSVHASRDPELGKGGKCIAHEAVSHQQTERDILWGTNLNVQKQQQLYDVSKA